MQEKSSTFTDFARATDLATSHYNVKTNASAIALNIWFLNVNKKDYLLYLLYKPFLWNCTITMIIILFSASLNSTRNGPSDGETWSVGEVLGARLGLRATTEDNPSHRAQGHTLGTGLGLTSSLAHTRLDCRRCLVGCRLDSPGSLSCWWVCRSCNS